MHAQWARTVAFLLLSAVAVPSMAGDWTYSGSLGVASGTYGLSERTTSVSLFNGLSWSRERFRFSASIPVLYQDSPYITYPGGVPTPTGEPGGTGAPGYDDIGIGDPLLRFDARVAGTLASGVGVFLSAKPPLADPDSGFGTGEWDLGGGVSVHSQAWGGRLFAEVGYWSYGDLPDLKLEDPLVATFGYGRIVSGGDWSWMVSAWALSETIDQVDGPAELSVAVMRRLGDRRWLSLTVAAGLNDSAADWRAVVGWTIGL